MRLLSNFKITSRIMMMVFLFLFIIIVTQAINLYQLGQAKDEIHKIAKKDIPIIKLISEITKYQLEQAVHFQRAIRFGKFMIINDDAKKAFFDAENRSQNWGKEAAQKINTAIKFVKQTPQSIDNPIEKKQYNLILSTLKQVKSDNNIYNREVEKVYEHILNNEFSKAEIMAQSVEKKEDRLITSLRELLKGIVEGAKESSQQANLREQFSQRLMYVLSIISIAITLFLGLAIARSIIVPLKFGTIIAKKISKGQDSIHFPENTNDEIGQLMTTMNNMLDIIKEKERELIKSNEELEKRVSERTLELKEKNLLLASNNKELTRLNKLKNEFLGIAAHDMRNPISIIMGYSDLLSGPVLGEISPEHKKVVLRIKQNCKNIVGLINNLLDISAIESGYLKLNLEQTADLKDFLVENCKSLSLLAKSKSITLKTELPDHLPPVLMDKEKINQVISNLVANAIKFSHPETQITLKALIDNNNQVVVSVSDQGKGIPEKEMSLLFKKFSKTSTAPTAGEKTTGLGLAIVKKIIEAHGSKIWVTSKEAEGSVFSFILPKA